jgi:hypothetical protein
MFPILLLFLYPFENATAQTTTSGALTGVVTDPSKAIVPEAVVRLRDATKGTTQATIADREGVYRFFFLPPGRYTLTVTQDGFQEATRTMEILLGSAVSVNVRLEIMKENTTVKVMGEVPLIQAENGDVSTTMSQLQISEVPNPGNDLTYIAQTAPGAIMNTDTIGVSYLGNFSILGMPGTSNLFTLNGINNNNIQTNTNNSGAMGMLLGQNEIQEATIVSNGYSGQFGGAAGANINYITKSGGNNFHGNAVYYWNGRVFNANDWIDNALGKSRPFDNANQWAGSLGGPIKKDKLFFFFDTEGVRVLLPVSSQVVLPSAQFQSATIAKINSIFGATSASHEFYEQMFNLYNGTPGASAATRGNFNPKDPTGCNGFVDPTLDPTSPCAVHFLKNLGRPSSESILSGRVDWKIGVNDRAFLLVQYDHGQSAVYVDPISPLFNIYSNQRWWQGQLSETHTIGAKAANQFLLAGTYLSQVSSPANPSQTLAALPTTLNWFAAGFPFTSLGGLDYQYALPTGARTTQYQITDDFVKTRDNHKFGFGVNFLRADQTAGGYTFSGLGELNPQSIGAFFYGGLDPSHPKTDFTTLFQTFPTVTWNHFAFYTVGLYAQDEWHARSNLTLTVAIRADHQSNPVCQDRCFARLAGPFNSVSHDPAQPYDQAIAVNQRQAFLNTDSILWAPRFSFAWQPLGVSGNSVIRGGFGIFYDRVPGGIGGNYNPPLINFFTVAGYNLAPNEQNSLSHNAAASNAAFSNGFASGQTLAQIQTVDPTFSPPYLQTPASRTHSPQYQKWSLQAQQTFGAATSLTIGYFGNHGIHELVLNPNANAFGFGSFPARVCSSPPVLPCADPRFGRVTQVDTDAVSNYNGMVVSFEHRFTHWGQGLFQANYTYGHALDEISNGGLAPFAYGSFGGSLSPQDPTNLRGSYGSADYDARQSFNANYVWQVPVMAAFRGHGPGYLVNGWQISGTIFARTGFPYTVFDITESGNLVQNNLFGPIYSVPVAPLGPPGPCGKGAVIPSSPVPCLPPQVLPDGSPNSGALFVQTGCETGFNTGNLPGPSGPCSGPAVSFAQGRNRFRYPNYFNTDLAVMKYTKLPHWENGVLSIGFRFFNVFNHPNFGMPDNFSSDATFGQIQYQEQAPTSVLGSGLNANVSGRMIQVKAQIQF